MTISKSHKKKDYFTYSLIVLLLLFFGLEFSDKLSSYYFPENSFSQYIKATILLGILAYQTIARDYKFIAVTLVLLITYCIGQSVLETSFSGNSMLTFFKFLFPLLLFAYVNKGTDKRDEMPVFFKTFEWLMLINSVLIVVGAVFTVKLFQTYQAERFGFNGVFKAVSTGSYAYIITLFYFLLTYKEKAVKNWKFILIFISCGFIGTKAVYLAMVFSLGYLIVVSKIPYKKVALSCVAVLGFGAAYYFFFQYDLFNTIRQSDGMLSAILSYRDQLLLEKTLPYIRENWSWVNYLFGGVSDFDLRSQMDLIDVFFFWGIVGGMFYLYAFLRLLMPLKMNSTGWVFLSFLAFIVLISGNFFVYSFVALFLVLFKLRLEETPKIAA